MTVLGIVILLLYECFFAKMGFSYMDEIIVVIIGGLACLYYAKKRSIREYFNTSFCKKITYCVIALYIVGSAGAIIYNYQNDIKYELVSGLFSIKFFVAYVAMTIFAQTKVFGKNRLVHFLKFLELQLIIGCVLMALDQLFPIFPYSVARFNAHSTWFIFEHSTEVACYAVVLMVLSVYLRKVLNFKRKYYKNIIPAIICIICCGRYKALGFVAVFLVMVFFKDKIKKFRLIYLIPLAIIAFFVARTQIEYYFNPDEARGAMYLASGKIAVDHIPLGTGFGTFGTKFSTDRYSPVYIKYGIQNVYGISKSMSGFATDAQWPAVLGETGFVGLLLVIVILYLILKRILAIECPEGIKPIIISMVVYLLIESTADSIFMSSRGVLIGVVIAFMIRVVNIVYQKKGENGNESVDSNCILSESK